VRTANRQPGLRGARLWRQKIRSASSVTGGGITYQIIGVVGNVKARTLGEETRPVLYRSLPQSVAERSVPHRLHAGDARARAIPQLLPRSSPRRGARTLDPSHGHLQRRDHGRHIRTAYFLPRMAATLFGAFGFIGLVLAVVGLYGVISYAVSRGARARSASAWRWARRLVAWSAWCCARGWCSPSIAIAWAGRPRGCYAKVASSFLYGIQPHDALTFAIVPPFLVVVALAACWIPARRAASIDPMQALRAE
jgi:hypothetical protein